MMVAPSGAAPRQSKCVGPSTCRARAAQRAPLRSARPPTTRSSLFLAVRPATVVSKRMFLVLTKPHPPTACRISPAISHARGVRVGARGRGRGAGGRASTTRLALGTKMSNEYLEAGSTCSCTSHAGSAPASAPPASAGASPSSAGPTSRSTRETSAWKREDAASAASARACPRAQGWGGARQPGAARS